MMLVLRNYLRVLKKLQEISEKRMRSDMFLFQVVVVSSS